MGAMNGVIEEIKFTNLVEDLQLLLSSLPIFTNLDTPRHALYQYGFKLESFLTSNSFGRPSLKYWLTRSPGH